MPEISRNFSHMPQAELLSKLVLTLPALVTAILAPIAGFFVDFSGRKRVMIYSLLLYSLAGTSGAYLNDLYLILAGRAFLGMAVGGIMTAGTTLIGDFFEGESRSRFMGYQAAFAGLGGLLFIVSGGVLADISWRMPFLIYISALGVLLMVWRFIPEPPRIDHIKHEPQSKDGEPEKSLIRLIPSAVWLVYIIAFFSMAVFYMIPVQMPFFLSAMPGVSNTAVGVAIAFMNITAVSMALNYGRIKRRMSFHHMLSLIYFFIFMGYLIISQAGSYTMMVAGILVSGLGFGLQMANLNLWLITLAPAQMRGRLTGYLNSVIFLGMFLSPVLLQPLVSGVGLSGSFLGVAIILIVLAFVFLCCAGARLKQAG